jgi:hypothetical protein
MSDQPMNEQESLRLITEMIGKAKKNIHETGTSAILWGSVIALCGFVTFAEIQWNFRIGFDVWILTLVALVPQVIISIRQSRQQVVKTHTQEVVNAIWLVYTISIFALVFYFNTVPKQTDRLLQEAGVALHMSDQENGMMPFHMFIPSAGSLLILLYGIPTLATGLAYKWRPMLIGAILCYCFFVISCFVANQYDYLLNAFAGIANWLIPGILLRRRYLREKQALHV